MTTPSYNYGILFTKAYRVLRSSVYASLGKYNLNPTEWSLIGLVHDSKDGIRLSEVANILDVKAPAVTMMADTLINRKLIVRIPNQIDARAKLLVITPIGKSTVKKVEQTLEIDLKPLLNGLSRDDLEIYAKVLETIIKNGKK